LEVNGPGRLDQKDQVNTMAVIYFPIKSTEHRSPKCEERDESITGRDGYIIAKALAYAIEAIGALPGEYQERSDREDMKAILSFVCPYYLRESVTEDACNHLFHLGSPLVRNTQKDLNNGDKPAA
jgi:hypothetical protein